MTTFRGPVGTPRSSNRPSRSVTAPRSVSATVTSIPESLRRVPRSRTTPAGLTGAAVWGVTEGPAGGAGATKLNAYWMRTGIASSPLRAGASRRRRAASSAASSNPGWGGVATSAALTTPCASTSIFTTTRAAPVAPGGYAATTGSPIGCGGVMGRSWGAGAARRSGCGSGTGCAAAAVARAQARSRNRIGTASFRPSAGLGQFHPPPLVRELAEPLERLGRVRFQLVGERPQRNREIASRGRNVAVERGCSGNGAVASQPGRVAKSAGRESPGQLGIGSVAERFHDRGGGEVGKVGGVGHGAIVRRGVHVEKRGGARGGPQCAPGGIRLRAAVGAAGRRADRHGRALEEGRHGRRETAELGSGHRMRSDEHDAILLRAAPAPRLFRSAPARQHRRGVHAARDGEDRLHEIRRRRGEDDEVA